MNILPHKSWHVYNQKNREKVQRDEAQAKEQEQQINDRAIKADREYRLNELRRKAKERRSNTTDAERSELPHELSSPQSSITSPKPDNIKLQHINFWSETETQGKKDHGYQKKPAPEKIEGTRLGPVKGNGKAEWYLEDTRKRRNNLDDTITRNLDREASKGSSKDRYDPLNAMKNMINKRDSAHEKIGRPSSSSSQSSLYLERKKRRDVVLPSESKVAPTNSIEKLRKERLEREEAERTKARALMDPHHANSSNRHSSSSGYNQQFNPDATRQAHRPNLSRSTHNTSERYQERHYSRSSVSEASDIGDDDRYKRRKYR
ncbi:Leukocyte receptor cluster member 1 [Mortierella sp. AM989]|nr:Leukocyte receptor cluster member 1 [Mortierella sp. AM989]